MNIPVDTSGVVAPANLGANVTWTSKWYSVFPDKPYVSVTVSGNQALAANGLAIEEAIYPPGSTTIEQHRQTAASSAAVTYTSGATSRNVATVTAKVLGPWWRVVIKNGASVQASLRAEYEVYPFV